MAGAAAASKYVMQDGKAIYRADDSPDVIEFNNCLVSMVGVLRSGTRTKLIPKIKEAESLQKALFSRLEADDRRLREELMVRASSGISTQSVAYSFTLYYHD